VIRGRFLTPAENHGPGGCIERMSGTVCASPTWEVLLGGGAAWRLRGVTAHDQTDGASWPVVAATHCATADSKRGTDATHGFPGHGVPAICANWSSRLPARGRNDQEQSAILLAMVLICLAATFGTASNWHSHRTRSAHHHNGTEHKVPAVAAPIGVGAAFGPAASVGYQGLKHRRWIKPHLAGHPRNRAAYDTIELKSSL
jgi:hypothetical protein